ncbi:GMC family oxidoreductase N-terminal domain-containing protein [Mycobacterium sp. MYCO198283]|uniref:GMC family oxidoreductase n=1 Tax=Mycobacterium sp. MYCO198283 TaxID=2883505 RepID=UPI001E44CEF8|nr:GMC family oxidoreductase N-terminal domain-containing protein [Mycobacterium sp. MYCO198283]MCG5430724.1 GMC family oxidoreductase N-terminal domain-containing protein [Mycobacterium sp. MYCO198283]
MASTTDSPPTTADYVVVGTGSAGAVLANRLSADPQVSVVALEAGPPDSNRFVHVPAAFSKLFRTELDWDYATEPQPALGGRRVYWPRGKLLGGSSSMNAMMWVRGFAADYDEWAELAGPEWSYREVLEYFRRIENTRDAATVVDRTASGSDGPLHISRQRSPRSATAAYLTAVQQCGHPLAKPNSAQPEGFTETVVTQRRGARWSTADGYLKPAAHRKNLTVTTGALATRVLVERGRAVGVEYQTASGRQVVHARREVVLCGGAVNSPQLLLLSGIGDRDQLAEHGIDVVHHAPEVGRNLKDHLCTPLGFDVKHDSLFTAEKPLELLNYLIRRRGMLTSNVGEAYGFVRSRPDLELPDLELLFAPAPFFDEGLGDRYDTHAVVLGPILVRPRSTGSVTLASADPTAKPRIDPRYLADERDREAMMTGLRMSAEIARAPALRDVLGKVARPLPQASGAQRELYVDDIDDEILAEALRTTSQTLYHPTGTCRMGRDERSVVDPELRVRGVEGLRVADASVMPEIIRGHTHAPAVVIGEKASDLIRSAVRA